MTNLNPTEATSTETKVSVAVVGAAAPRIPSQAADTEVRGVTPKDMEVESTVEEINVFPHFLRFWLGILRWPF